MLFVYNIGLTKLDSPACTGYNTQMLITDQNTLNTFCRNLEDKDFITVDTEFLREKTYYPKLCLIQIGDPHRTAAAIDPLEGNLDLSPIFELMLNDKILKIFHAGRQDLEKHSDPAKPSQFHSGGRQPQPDADALITIIAVAGLKTSYRVCRYPPVKCS